MKRLLTILLIASSPLFVKGQGFDVAGISYTPNAPVCNQNLTVTMGMYYFCSNYVFSNVTGTVVGSRIYIDQYWTLSGTCSIGAIGKKSETLIVVPPTAGVYQIVARIYENGTILEQDSIKVTVGSCCSAVAGFTYSPSFVCPGGTMSFSNTSTGASVFEWKKDGVVFSTTSGAATTFPTPGMYTISLIAGTGTCEDSTAQQVEVIGAPTVAAFSYTATNYDYSFTDNSSGNKYVEYLWDFGDGNTDTARNATHQYALGDTGVHTVCFTATNTCGTDSICQDVVVTCPLPIAGFNLMFDSLTISATDLSDHATQWYWTFGDGSFTGVKDPSYTYGNAGTYEICLVASSDCGSDTTCQTITVGPTGFREASQPQLSIAPNPFSGSTVIDLKEKLDNLTVYDLLGRDMTHTFSWEQSGHEVRLYHHEKENGTYLLRINGKHAIIQVY